jgi:hypothetical protein
MRFPLAWPAWKVFLVALIWPLLLLGVSLWADVDNLEARQLPTYSIVSVFFEHRAWPVWLYLVAWLPVLIWRLALPPVSGEHTRGAV